MQDIDMENTKKKKQCTSKEFIFKWWYTSNSYNLQWSGSWEWRKGKTGAQRTGAQGESFPGGGSCWALSWRMNTLVTWSNGWGSCDRQTFRWEQPLWSCKTGADNKGTSAGGGKWSWGGRWMSVMSNFILCHAEKFDFWPLGRWTL